MTSPAMPPPAADSSTTGDPLRGLVAAMDRLRSPGGCPWDAEQTHESLVKYTLEETYELVETIEAGDRPGLREELGDVLFQVVFHARVAQEHPDDPFDLDDVAADLTAKLLRRHPHVFGDDEYVDEEHLTARWDAIKQEEKARDSVLDGIPLDQGALSRAQKVVTRVRRAGLPDDVAGEVSEGDDEGRPSAGQSRAGQTTADQIGSELLAVVRRAQDAGVDAEGALRATLRRLDAAVREAEQRLSRGVGPADGR